VDSPEPPSQFVRGPDDLPQYVADYEVPFTVVVPKQVLSIAVGTTDTALAMIQPFLETGITPMPCDGICDPD